MRIEMNRVYAYLVVLLLFTGVIGCEQKVSSSSQSSDGGELDTEIEAKIDKIMANMSQEEKIGQMCQVTLDVLMKRDSNDNIIEPNVLDPERVKKALVEHKVGSILNVGYHTFDREKWYEIIEYLQQVATEETDSKIPLIYGIDAIHGVTYTVDGTLFPQEIGLAGTWNKQCAEDLGAVTAYETRASGISWNFSPVLDLGRQPLWSRFFETLGEDVYLTKKMGENIVHGYQGDDPSSKTKVVSCLKHFVGYSNPASGRDRTPALIPERYMEEYYLPPFKDAVDAGALTVMVNSGEVNGIPGHSNYHLLTEVLKERWGFKGFAVSDWEDMIMLNTVAQIEPNYKEAIANAVNAGVDMSMVPYSPFYEKYCKLLLELVAEKKVSQARIDDAVRRILRVKIVSGLFDEVIYPAEDYQDFGSDQFQEKAYQAASESITLLKNEKNILPLSKGSKVLVTGPTAHSLNCLNGAWTHTWQGVDPKFNTKGKKTILESLQSTFGLENVSYAVGVEMSIEEGWETNQFKDIDKTIQEAQTVDYVVVCLGEMPGTERPGDIRSLNLAKEQQELVKRLSNVGKPIILVLVEGHPRIIREIESLSSAIIQAYLPGNEGGRAIADVVSGKVNPSGKLPYTYPRYDGVIEHYDHKFSEDKGGKSSEPNAYNPQWDFGFGMSYSTFSYTNLSISKDTIEVGGSDQLTISVNIRNTSRVQGKEVVQLYIKDDYASISPCGRRLRGFDKIDLKAGEGKTVSFKVTAKDLRFVGRDNEWINEEGSFTIMIENLQAKFYLKCEND